MGYTRETKHGHNMYDMSSLMQKAIRRCDLRNAAYAAQELYDRYYKYTWKRLLVISAEDCYGIMTKEIIGLKAADDVVNEGRKAGDRDTIFISKAIMLLCMARKNRDACYVACNLFSAEKLAEPDEIPEVDNFDNLTIDHIPDWTYDCHTIRGKMNGKDDLDMVNDEQIALKPLQTSIFDNGDWNEDMSVTYNKPEKLHEWQKDKKTTDECIEQYFGSGSASQAVSF